MDESLLFGSLVRGLLGVRPKRSMRALRYLTGGSLLSNPATLLTAAGLAWGVIDTLRNQGQAEAAVPIAGVANPAVVPPPLPGTDPVTPPPLPVEAPPSSMLLSDDGIRLVRLAISAAYADGTVNEHERAAIVRQAQAAGARDIVERELQYPKPLKDIVAGVTDAAQRATLYVLAFTIVRADEQVSGAERIYLAQLANLLGLDAETIAALEKDTGERIAALGDQGQPGG